MGRVLLYDALGSFESEIATRLQGLKCLTPYSSFFYKKKVVNQFPGLLIKKLKEK